MLLQNGAKFIQKTDSWFQKSYEEFWITSDKQWKVQKAEIQWATFVQKYIPSAKILYGEDLSNITFNYLCENSPNF